jgi:hypothetical protein
VNSRWQNDMARSSKAFVEFAWPAVEKFCGGGRLEMVESTSAQGFVRDLDVLAGIDAWQLLDGRGYMRGIASRMQADPRDWRTFTIRRSRTSGARTEFEKRVQAIQEHEHGALYPALTVHGYVATWDKGPLLSAAVVRTADLYSYIVEHEAEVPWRPTSNATFYCPTWSQLQAAGLDVRVWSQDAHRMAGA